MRGLRVAVDAAQVELTRAVVSPGISALLDLARRHREAVDAEIHAEIEAGRPVRGAPQHENYPIGWCGPICERIFLRLSDDPMVREWIAHGVIWKRVYFIQDASMFQNAIQCGNAILDVANDSVRGATPPVEWYPLDGGFDWENLEGYSQSAAVAQKYYGATLFPNRIFPLLAPFAPFLKMEADGSFRIFRPEHMLFFPDVVEGWPRFRALIADAQKTQGPLPAAQRTFLGRCIERARACPPPVELREATNGELAASLSQWGLLKDLPPGRFRGSMARMEGLLRETNAWLAAG